MTMKNAQTGIKTVKELESEMKQGGSLFPPNAVRKGYRLMSTDNTFRSVSRSAAESVLNDIRFRNYTDIGSYIYKPDPS